MRIRRQSIDALFKKILPFDQLWVRYALCLSLLLSCGLAGWALFVISPQRESLAHRSQSIIELEKEFLQAKDTRVDVASLQAQADSKKSRLFTSISETDERLYVLLKPLQNDSWEASVTNVETDSNADSSLVLQRYRIQLHPQTSTEEPKPKNVLSPLTDLLDRIKSETRPVAIESLRIDKDGEAAKAQLTLVATIAR